MSRTSNKKQNRIEFLEKEVSRYKKELNKIKILHLVLGDFVKRREPNQQIAFSGGFIVTNYETQFRSDMGFTMNITIRSIDQIPYRITV